MKNREILKKYYAKQSEEKSRKIKQMLKMLNFRALKPESLNGHPESAPCSFLPFDLQFQAK